MSSLTLKQIAARITAPLQDLLPIDDATLHVGDSTGPNKSSLRHGSYPLGAPSRDAGSALGRTRRLHTLVQAGWIATDRRRRRLQRSKESGRAPL